MDRLFSLIHQSERFPQGIAHHQRIHGYTTILSPQKPNYKEINVRYFGATPLNRCDT
jgi:hypothetical protein